MSDSRAMFGRNGDWAGMHPTSGVRRPLGGEGGGGGGGGGGGESVAEMVVVSGTPADSPADPQQLNGKVLLFLGFGGGRLQQAIGKAQPAAILFATTLPEQQWQERTEQQSRPVIQF